MVNYSRIIGEAMVLMKKPSVSESPSGRAPERAPDGILRRQKLVAAEKYFRGSLPWFHIFQGFIGGRSRAEEPEGAHKPARHAPRLQLGGLWPPLVPSALVLKSSGSLLLWKKSSRRFYSVWTTFIILI